MKNKEPVALGALVTAGVNAVLFILSAFGVADLDGQQTAAVFLGVNFLVLAVVAIKTRSVVFSQNTVTNADVEAHLSPHDLH